MSLRPAGVDTGIVFRRTDIPHSVAIPAHAERVSDTHLSTSLSLGGVQVSTVEHLLSAFAGLGIDNAYVEVDGPEVPIMDGSAAPFVFLIQAAGIQTQLKPKRFIRIRRTVEVRDGVKWARFDPGEGFRLQVSIDFDHPVFTSGSQAVVVDFSETSFVKQLSRARTFGFLQDIERLRADRLALGGSLANAVVLDHDRVLNAEGLRFRDEFVRHKVLDAVGDLYLLGCGLIGCFRAHCTGHALNNRLSLALLAERDAWEVVTFPANDRLITPKRELCPARSAA